MNRVLNIAIAVLIVAVTGLVIADGVAKKEVSSVDAGSMVGYGSPDTGDTIVRLRTDSMGILQIVGQ